MYVYLFILVLFLGRSPSQGSLLIETDMGQDDMVAIAMLLSACAREALAGCETISLVSARGLQGESIDAARVAQRYILALQQIPELAHVTARVKVYDGASDPLSPNAHSRQYPAELISHCQALPDRINLPPLDPKWAPLSNAHEEIVRMLQSERVRAIELAAPTALASALMEVNAENITNSLEVFLMGGGIWTPSDGAPGGSEWNVYLDPQAVKIVLGYGRTRGHPIMIGLDVTQQAPVRGTMAYLQHIRRNPYRHLSLLGHLLVSILQDLRVSSPNAATWDAVAVYRALSQERFKSDILAVEVDENTGQTRLNRGSPLVEVPYYVDFLALNEGIARMCFHGKVANV